MTAVRQKRNCDKRLADRPLVIGVWLHNVRRKKGRNAKFDCPLEGPYLVLSVLPDVVYRIRKRGKANPRSLSLDRLKPYVGTPLEICIPKRQTQLSSLREEGRETSGVDSSVFVDDGQSTAVKERQGLELDETESRAEDKDDVSPRPQDADCIGDDNGD